jgi:hypothetical protein
MEKFLDFKKGDTIFLQIISNICTKKKNFFRDFMEESENNFLFIYHITSIFT